MNRERKYDETLWVSSKDIDGINDLGEHIRNGELAAFPTETVYGLGADALNEEAVSKIFVAKGRPGDNPLIVHIYDRKQVDELVSEVTPLARKMMDAFMPGPITLVMKRKVDVVPDVVTAGLDTVGIRMPASETALAFLKACDRPIAAPSANLSGSPSPTKAVHVMNDMNGYIYGILDGGECDVGLESTVVNVTGDVPVILRPGKITKEDIDKVCDCNTEYAGSLKEGSVPEAPGMKYRHYAPNAVVEIVSVPDIELIEINDETDFKNLGDEDKEKLFSVAGPFLIKCREMLDKNPTVRIGIYAGEEVKALLYRTNDDILQAHINFYSYGRTCDVEAASHSLFDGLRHLDIQKVDCILASGFAETELGKAYMNRLNKAAGQSGEKLPNDVEAENVRQYNKADFEDFHTSSVLFVSDENMALGPICEGIMSQLIEENGPYCSTLSMKIETELYCESAGIYAMDGEEADLFAVKALKEVTGKSMKHHKARRACPSIYDNNDLILTMRDDQAFMLCEAFPILSERVFSISSYAASKGLVIKNEQGKVVSISIPDPKDENYKTYLHTVKALKAWLDILFPYIINDLGAELY